MTQSISTVQKQWVTIPIAENSPMEAYLAKPEGEGPWPAVIVLMEIFGINSHIREVTERIAAEGYVAIAPNYYHRTTQNMNLGYNEQDVEFGRQHKDQTTREGILVDIRATIQFLQDQFLPDQPDVPLVSPQEKIGCIGFCFGGHVAYIAAGMNDIAATASFYPGGVAVMSPGGGRATVEHTNEIKGEILCLFGEQDPLIPYDHTVVVENALQKSGVQYEVVRYSNVGHGFFCNQRGDYDPSAAEDAWRRVKELFERVLQ